MSTENMNMSSSYGKCERLIKMLSEIKDIAYLDGNGEGFLPISIEAKLGAVLDTTREALALARCLDVYTDAERKSKFL